ncbi:unnamed protein product [Camellia sinensis]
MESKEAVKTEDSIRSSPFLDQFSVVGMLELGEKSSSSLGFMELLGIPDFNPSIFDMLQASTTPYVEPTRSTSEVLMMNNQPTTPNSSSISSESSVAPNDEQSKVVVDEEDEEHLKTKKQLLKPKKTSQKKREREPRFAFMTKSEVDHLEDGYRWRKYGQKAVKNSPFPRVLRWCRGYYRCTTVTCNVKKRVERSFSDPTIVVTTYEGKHTHPSPLVHRPTTISTSTSAAFIPARPGFSDPSANTNTNTAFALSLCRRHHHHPFQFFSNNNLPPPHLNCGYLSNYLNPTSASTNASVLLHERRFCNPASSALLADHGLLQDIVPSSLVTKDD